MVRHIFSGGGRVIVGQYWRFKGWELRVMSNRTGTEWCFLGDGQSKDPRRCLYVNGYPSREAAALAAEEHISGLVRGPGDRGALPGYRRWESRRAVA